MHPAALLAVLVLTMVPNAIWGSEGNLRGLRPVAVPIRGAQPLVYRESHALLIGCSTYVSWPSLPGVETDMPAVEAALVAQGFAVRCLRDPTSVQLRQGLEEFLTRHGLEPDNRLVIYFAGHGETARMSDGREMGYLVPVDAPRPEARPTAFRAQALDMRSVVSLAERMECRHALFIFDACSSGSVFAVRSGAALPAVVANSLTKPVRQFIAAGGPSEQVPDRSLFRRLLVRGIAGEADLSGDGYVTGSELGAWLTVETARLTRGSQNPISGKIRDLDLDQGDIVFAPGNPSGLLRNGSPQVAVSGGLPSGVMPTAPIVTDAPMHARLHLRDGREFTGAYDPAREELTQVSPGMRSIIHIPRTDVRRWAAIEAEVQPAAALQQPGRIPEDGIVPVDDPGWANFRPQVICMQPGMAADRFMLAAKTVPVGTKDLLSLKASPGRSPAGQAFDGDPETMWRREDAVAPFIQAELAHLLACRGIIIRTGKELYGGVTRLELAAMVLNGGEPIAIAPDAAISSRSPAVLEAEGLIIVVFGNRREVRTLRIDLIRGSEGFGIREVMLMK